MRFASLLGALLIAASGAEARPVETTLALPARAHWFDTGIAVRPGDEVMIAAAGRVYVGDLSSSRPSLSSYQGPAGDPRLTTQMQARHAGGFAAPGLAPWSLVGRIGQDGAPFEVGDRATISPEAAGELYLSVNDNHFGDNEGAWAVTIRARSRP